MARRSRKERPAPAARAPVEDAVEAPAPAPPAEDETSGAAMRRGSARSAERDEAVRATLTPLAPGEHPPALKIAIGVALALALANVVAFAAGADAPGQGSSAGGLVFVAVMLLAAWGMWRQRYWAVLGFAT